MFGAFKGSAVRCGGLVWKIGWRLSQPRKARHRRRLQQVDKVIDTVTQGLRLGYARHGYPPSEIDKMLPKKLQQYNDPSFFPREKDMSPKDKYTVFDRKARDYRKGVHKVPKWTKTPLPRDNKFH